MREIKFRVWNPELEETYKIAKENYLSSVGVIDNFVGGKESTWMQYTGLKDKNGTEIYEGDILTSHFYPFQDDGRYNYHGLVEWLDDPSGFYITKRLANHRKRGVSDGISELIENAGQFEVIGNIHEHKHLLGGVDK